MGRHGKTKWVAGPGGARCRCCRWGEKGDAKRRARRTERRQVRQNGFEVED